MGKIEAWFWDKITYLVTALFLIVLCVLFIVTVVTVSDLVLDRVVSSVSCYHPVTPEMRIFVGACLDEGYSFSQCYRQYVDAVEHGSVKLEMPTIIT